MAISLEPNKGRVLLSEPFLRDPNFSRTVVLITEYGEEGTVGFVLNHITDFSVDLLMPDLDMVKAPVFNGGPVEIESFHYIHSYQEIEGAVDLGKGVYWSGNFEQVVQGLKSGEYDPQEFKFFIGYSGWATGQLEEEMKENAWVVAEITKAMIFAQGESDQTLWQQAMEGLGGEFALLAKAPIDPQFN